MGDYRPTFLILGILGPVLATIFTGLRLDARRKKGGKWYKLTADDWCIVIALILCYGWSINIILDSQVGNLGGHTKFTPNGIPIPGPGAEVFLHTNYVSTVLVIPAVGFTKISIMLLYQRIFASHTFRAWSWVAIGVLIAWLVAFLFAMIFACWPLFAQWQVQSHGTCVDRWALYLAGVCSNTVTDILILTWPVYQISKLHMPLQRKIAVMAMFLLGGFVLGTGIARIYFLVKANSTLANPRFNDATYHYAPAIIWTIAELNLGVICASLPLLRPLWEGYRLNRMFSSMSIGLVSLAHSARASTSRMRSRTYTKYNTSNHGSQEHIRTKPSIVSLPKAHLPSGKSARPFEMNQFHYGPVDEISHRIEGWNAPAGEKGEITVQKEFSRRDDVV